MVAFASGSSELHRHFLAILPRIERHARIYFRHIKCHVRKEEAVAEAIALAWKWFVRLVRRGKDVSGFVSTLASFAAKAVRSGRRVCGMEKAKDVLSPRAQVRHGFTVSKLPDHSTLETNPLSEALQDNRRSPVPEQVAFRLDFPSWLRRFSVRDRRIIRDMAMSERTFELADRYGLSPGRISQLRRLYCDDWLRFTSDEAVAA